MKFSEKADIIRLILSLKTRTTAPTGVNEIKIAIIGMGYVGLPLSMEFAQSGIQVTGVDTDSHKVQQLQQGQSHVLDVPSSLLAIQLKTGNFAATTDFGALRDVEAVCICVPTPLRKSLDPDISYIVAAVEEVKQYLRPGMLVVLESTTYPGTTEELVLPRLAETGLEAGRDFFLAFSPERVDPGNKQYSIRNTPKVIGGITPRCTEEALKLYRNAVDVLIPVKSARAAEMVKLLENTYRAVNIGLVNELAIMCDRLKVDVWDVIDAAKTKPFGYMPFYPGPGLGGHCIPIDPLYLSWKLKTINYTARFIELASAINSSMPEYVVTRLNEVLNELGHSVKGSRILIMGVAYKRDVSDTRESPALDIIGLLKKRGAAVKYTDPYVAELEVLEEEIERWEPSDGYDGFDCVAILTDHKAFDYQDLVNHARVVFDARNALALVTIPDTCRVIKL